jgi:hypothetical protein
MREENWGVSTRNKKQKRKASKPQTKFVIFSFKKFVYLTFRLFHNYKVKEFRIDYRENYFRFEQIVLISKNKTHLQYENCAHLRSIIFNLFNLNSYNFEVKIEN